MLITELESGEFNGIHILEITEVPDISILVKDGLENKEFSKKHKKEFESLITEFFFGCKQDFNTQYQNQDYSLSLVFKSEKVENQTYNANIKTYILIRGINENEEYLQFKLSELENSIKASLKGSKYGVNEISNEKEIIEEIKDKANKEKRVIIKDYQMNNLQSMYLQECFTFDKFPTKSENFTKIITTLMQYPDCEIIIDLIPTLLNQNEIANIESYSNVLDVISKGVAGPEGASANILAEKPSTIYKYYETNKYGVLFSFNILICADYNYINTITNRLTGELSLGMDNEYAKLNSMEINNYEIDINTYFNSLPWVINEIVIDKNMQNPICTNSELGRLPFIITGEEASEFFRIPYGDNVLTAGVKINKSDIASKSYNKKVINMGDIMVGTLKSSTNDDKIGFSLGDLTKHMLVVGTPGSGKTTFSVSLLDRLWKEHNIPFLVIEPAKNEYRAMIDSIPDIQVFTPGKDFISPYILNPFIPPKNVRLQSYKTVLKTAFSAGVSMGTPLDKIFEDTLDECYSKAGWLPHYTIDDGAEIFTMDDFLKTFMEVFERIGYRGDAANIGKAGYVRFKSLLRLFGNYNTIPIEDLLKKPTIIELAAIENEDQKSLLIALLLLNIQSYVNANFLGTGEMKNVILLEEAHVLLAAGNDKSEGEANPSAVAKKLLTRMLAEIRSLGVGIVIADQSPEKVTTDVVKLTNIKLAFNLVEKNDRTILGDSTDMKDIQVERLAKLRPGEAFFYMNGLEEPEEVITEDYRKKVQIRTTISDGEIAEKTTYWNDKKDKLKPFIQCGCTDCCNEGCNYMLKAEAEEYAKRIFNESFNEQSKDRSKLVEVYKEIPNKVQEYAGDRTTKQLICCTKIQLLRKIIYNTKIPFSKEASNQTISNEYKRR
ncbi:MAG: ATP-binding protein [Clostridia bacterium]|nr:ATP-binding protein [Clostridia bacterium]